MKPKERFIESFFNIWSLDMAYVLGYLSADGSMYKNPRGSCYISFTSTDLELILLIKAILKVKNRIEVYQPRAQNWRLRYTLQIGSKKIFNKLLELGLTPNKSLTLKLPNVPLEYVGSFLRGYFDGDGSVYYGSIRRKGRDTFAQHLNFSLRSGSQEFLKSLQEVLRNLYQIKGSLCYQDRAFTLAYSGKSVVKLYRFLYPNKSIPHLARKRLKLEEGIRRLGS